MARIEYVILADHAEVVNGKLNMIGGGWGAIARQVPVLTQALPEGVPVPAVPPCRFAIAVSILYDWHEAGDVLPFTIQITDQDELRPPLWAGSGQIQTGRPPGAPRGGELRAPIGFLTLVQFPEAGGYVVHTAIPGQTEHRLPFQVVDQPIVIAHQPG
jgi:hypothetical protein